MLYKIDYTARGAGREVQGSKWVKFASDRTEAVSKFMDWFFVAHPHSKVRLDGLTDVELIGDMSAIEAIDDATN